MKRLLILVVFIFVFSSLAYADKVYLKSGKVLEGKILEQNAKYLRIDISGTQLRYYSEEIARVEKIPQGKPKIFELKPSPLLPIEPKQELVQGDINKSAAPEPGQTAKPLELVDETVAAAAPIDPQDKSDIENIVRNYLALVTKPLPADQKERELVLDKLSSIIDLDNAPAFISFRSAVEQARQGKAVIVGERPDNKILKDKFLESHVIGFGNKYLAGASPQAGSFKISNISLSEKKDQASVSLEYSQNLIKLKLHKINSKWSIYSTE